MKMCLHDNNVKTYLKYSCAYTYKDCIINHGGKHNKMFIRVVFY